MRCLDLSWRSVVNPDAQWDHQYLVWTSFGAHEGNVMNVLICRKSQHSYKTEGAEGRVFKIPPFACLIIQEGRRREMASLVSPFLSLLRAYKQIQFCSKALPALHLFFPWLFSPSFLTSSSNPSSCFSFVPQSVPSPLLLTCLHKIFYPEFTDPTVFPLPVGHMRSHTNPTISPNQPAR